MTTRDPEPRHRGGVILPEECWNWLRETADRDGSTRDDLLEGIVYLAMDAASTKPQEIHFCPNGCSPRMRSDPEGNWRCPTCSCVLVVTVLPAIKS